MEEGYSSKLKRDDLKHTIGLDVHSEEVAKAVPTLSNSVYGHPVLHHLETPDRKYVRVATVNKLRVLSLLRGQCYFPVNLEHIHVCITFYIYSELYKLYNMYILLYSTNCINYVILLFVLIVMYVRMYVGVYVYTCCWQLAALCVCVCVHVL